MKAVAGRGNGARDRGSRGSSARDTTSARERVLSTAYELFSHRGVRAVGVDTIINRAKVAKMTFYRHFPSKNALVLAFLERREQLWTEEWLEAAVMERASTAGDRLLAVFDVFDEWFQRDDFEGCSFINVLLEMCEPASAVRAASAGYLANIRTFLHSLAKDAGVAEPDDFARKWHILMKGCIVAAGEGDRLAARRARAVARLLLESQLRTR
jgi:AcrR family transcriptional regulator